MPVFQRNRTSGIFGKCFYDGKPKARTGDPASQNPVKRIKDSGHFRGRNAGTCVGDSQKGSAIRVPRIQIDTSSFGCVTDGVVDQVLQNGHGRHGGEHDCGVLFAGNAEINVFGPGQGKHVSEHLPEQGHEGNLSERFLSVPLRSGQCQKLVQKGAGSVQTAAEHVQAFPGRDWHLHGIKAFCLQ